MTIFLGKYDRNMLKLVLLKVYILLGKLPIKFSKKKIKLLKHDTFCKWNSKVTDWSSTTSTVVRYLKSESTIKNWV